ncbi:MAG: S-layer homology domain-containing protein [Candidatus Margulisiibacteriota bacterium]
MTRRYFTAILLILSFTAVLTAKTSLITDLRPGDSTKTTDKSIIIRGSVPETVKTVEIDGRQIDLTTSGLFHAQYFLPQPGKYRINVTATSITGENEKAARTVFRMASFADITEDTFAADAINQIATLGYLPDTIRDSFSPDTKVTRGELAEILVKAKKVDLFAGNMAAPNVKARRIAYLEEASNQKILVGYPSVETKDYENKLVNRAEAVAALVKLEQEEPLPLVIQPPFIDVTASNWAAPYIEYAKNHGWLDYFSTYHFNPKKLITRSELYYLLGKTSLVREDLKRLFASDDSFMVRKTGVVNKQRLISMDLKNIDIASVLRGFSTETGYNIVTDKNVSGKITARFTSVEPMEALQQILKANNFRYLIEGNTLRIYGDLDAPQQDKDIKTFTINYANIDNLAAELIKLVPSLEDRILIGKSSNSIIIDGAHPEINKIQEIVRKLDAPPRQVMVEAKIFEINVDSDTTLGIQFKDSRAIGNTQLTTETTGFSGAPVAGTSTGFFVQVIRNAGNQNLYLNALASRTDLNLISTPKIMALNNQSASLITGSNLGYVTQKTSQSTGGTVVAEEVLFIQTGVDFTFTPQITDDDNIKIEINPVISDGELDASGVPQVRNTSAKTTVLVRDNQTFIIGGLITSRLENVENKVPFIGDIPFIGNFFKSELLKEIKKELIILVTPHIINQNSFTDMDSEIRGLHQRQRTAEDKTSLFW